MRNLLIVLTALVSLSCGGGGGGSEPSPPGAPTSPTPPITTAAGEPASADWTLLTGQLAIMGNDALKNALVPSASAAADPFRIDPMNHLPSPAQGSSVTTQYFCCGSAGSALQPTSHVLLDNSITIVPGASGSFTLAQNFRTVSTTEWISTTGGVKWRLDATDLRIFGSVRTAAGVVDAAQEFRLQGTITYVLPSGEARRADINVVLNYANFETGSPTATGQAGPLLMPGQVLAPLVSPARCSRPLEGCACTNGCTGTAPCTGWPRCPGF